jgi:hypothetical protein
MSKMPNATKTSTPLDVPESPYCKQLDEYAEKQQREISAMRPSWTQGSAAKSDAKDS